MNQSSTLPLTPKHREEQKAPRGSMKSVALRALALGRQGKSKEALEEAERAMHAMGEDDHTLEAVTGCFREAGRQDKAAEAHSRYRDSIPEDPAAAEAHLAALMAAEKFSEAQRDAMRLFQSSGKERHGMYAAAASLIRARLEGDARQAEVALRTLPAWRDGWSGKHEHSAVQADKLKCDLLCGAGRLEEAFEAVPPRPEAKRERANLLRQFDSLDHALDAYLHAIDEDPGDIVAARSAMQMLVDNGQEGMCDRVLSRLRGVRAVALAEMELARIRGDSPDLRQKILRAQERLGTWRSAPEDIVPFARYLKSEDASEADALAHAMRERCRAEMAEEQTDEEALAGLRAYVSAKAIERAALRSGAAGDCRQAEEARGIMEVYRRASRSWEWEGLKDERDQGTADALPLLAARELVDWARVGGVQEGRGVELLIEADGILEEGLTTSPFCHWLWLLQMHVRGLLGGDDRGAEAMQRLGIKNFLLDSMAHHFLGPTVANGRSEEAFLRSVASSAQDTELASAGAIQSSFEKGGFAKGAELAEFFAKLRQSHARNESELRLSIRRAMNLGPRGQAQRGDVHSPWQGTGCSHLDGRPSFTHDLRTRDPSAPPGRSSLALFASDWWAEASGRAEGVLFHDASSCIDQEMVPDWQKRSWWRGLERLRIVARVATRLANGESILDLNASSTLSELARQSETEQPHLGDASPERAASAAASVCEALERGEADKGTVKEGAVQCKAALEMAADLLVRRSGKGGAIVGIEVGLCHEVLEQGAALVGAALLLGSRKRVAQHLAAAKEVASGVEAVERRCQEEAGKVEHDGLRSLSETLACLKRDAEHISSRLKSTSK